MMSKLPIEGSCLCGAVTYRVEGEPLDAGYCHCSVCRRASGAPTVAWATVPIERFTFVKGKPARYESTPRGAREFCATCGTQLTFQYTHDPKTIDFTLGSLKDPESIRPQYHIWTETRLGWFDTADSLPRHEGQGPDRWT
jgi:hypothetical protein